MITLHGADQDITLINVRSGEKEKYSWDDMMEAIGLLMEGDTPEESWAKTYGENSSVAPVQLDPKSKVTKAAEPKPGRQGAESRCSGRDRTGAVATRNVKRRRDFVEGTGGKERI